MERGWSSDFGGIPFRAAAAHNASRIGNFPAASDANLQSLGH
jgi:hypothetical protein